MSTYKHFHNVHKQNQSYQSSATARLPTMDETQMDTEEGESSKNTFFNTKNFLKGAVNGVSSAVTGVNSNQGLQIDQLNQKKIDSLNK